MSRPVAASPGALPLLAGATVAAQGHMIVVQRRLSLAADPWLQDHTLGGAVSREDPGLCALPVLPLAMALELMAEAAALLSPGQLLVRIAAVRAMGWLPCPDDGVLLTVQARWQGEEVQALLLAGDQPKVTATMAFSDRPPALAAAAEGPAAAGPLLVSREALYPDALFHGPAFRILAGVRAWDQGGIETMLAPPPASLAIPAAARLLAAPLQLDAAGQSAGLWAQQFLAEGFVIFPTGVEEIELAAPAGEAPLAGSCRVSIHAAGDQGLLADGTLRDAAGRPWCRIRGLRHRRVPMPAVLHRFRGRRQVLLTSALPMPPLVAAGRALPAALAGGDWQDLGLTGADGAMLEAVIAHIVLSRQERRLWQGMAGEPGRRAWLLDRLAVKEAVRRLVRQEARLDPWSADLAVDLGPDGQATVRSRQLADLGWQPAVAIGRLRDRTLALAVRLPGPGWGVRLRPAPGTRGRWHWRNEDAIGGMEIEIEEPNGMSDSGLSQGEIEAAVVAIVQDMTRDWDLDFTGEIGPKTRLVGDLAFESIDIVQFIVAMEERFQRRGLPWEEILMQDGRYVDEIRVGDAVGLLAKHLA
ncbi:MAG: polyketide synthase dehydratase domain-containing protein [Thermodesulfobacteriota bacterium]